MLIHVVQLGHLVAAPRNDPAAEADDRRAHDFT